MDPLLQAVIGWEMATLGTAIHRPETIDIAIAQGIRPGDFTGSHQELWAEIVALYNREALDLRSLVESLRSRGTLGSLGSFDTEMAQGEAYIEYLLQQRGTNMEEYIEQVIRAATRRALAASGALISAEAQDTGVPVEEVIAHAEQRLIDIRKRRDGDQGATLKDIIGAFIPRLNGMRNGTVEPAWVPAVQGVRDIIAYAEDEDYIIIAARPGEGKSSLLRHEMLKAAMNGIGSVVFNMENSEVEYARYSLAHYLDIDSQKLKSPRSMTAAEVSRVQGAAEELSNLPVHVVSLGGPSVTQIDAIARQKILKHDNIGLIFVDYVQLLNNGMPNDVSDLTRSSQTLRAMALRYKIPVIAAAQLNRAIEHRGDNAEPVLADLRQSGSLEQDATMVWFLRKIWSSPTENDLRRYPQNTKPDGSMHSSIKAEPIRVHIKKNRNGPTGTTGPILWVKSTGKFLTLTDQ